MLFKRFLALLGTILLFLVVLSSCDNYRGRLINTGPSTPTIEYVEDFLPLSIGSSWTYQSSYWSSVFDTTFVDTFEVENIEELLFAGQEAVARETHATFSSIDYYTISGDTMYRWVYDDWETQTPESYMPNRRAGDTLSHIVNNAWEAVWRVEKTDSSVTVPAGTFNFCFLVRYKRYSIGQDNPSAQIDLLIKSGVGKIMTRSMLFGSEADTTAMTTNTLIDYVIMP